jgi:hypothetical protein
MVERFVRRVLDAGAVTVKLRLPETKKLLYGHVEVPSSPF